MSYIPIKGFEKVQLQPQIQTQSVPSNYISIKGLEKLQPQTQTQPEISPLLKNPISRKAIEYGAEIQEGISNFLKDPLGTLYGTGKALISTPVEAVKNLAQKAAETIVAYQSPGTPLAEKIAKPLETLGASASVVFSPLTAAFQAAEKLPILKPAADIINLPWMAIGKVGEFATDKFVDVLPINKQSKDILRPAFEEAGSLAAQIALGGKVMDLIAKKASPVIEKPEVDKIVEEAKQEAPKVEEQLKTAQTISAQKPEQKPIVPETKPQPAEIPVKSEVKPEETKPFLIKPNKPEVSTPVETTAIPKELEPLAEEARKYKSAEEFVDAAKKRIVYNNLKQRAIDLGPRAELVFGELGKVGEKSIMSDEQATKIAKSQIEPLRTRAHQLGSVDAALTDFYNQVTKGIKEIKPEVKITPEVLRQKEKEALKTEVPKIEIPEPTQPTKSIELTSGLNPNLDKFIEQDFKPVATSIIGKIGGAFRTLKNLFIPTKASEEAVKTASILRTELAKQAREKELLYHKISDARKVFDRYTQEQAIDFIDKIETGQPIEGSENFVKVIREALDDRWEKIQNIKGTDAYIENYFPHLWKDPQKASETLAKYFGKRPLEGTKSFLKQRKIPTVKEGIELGLEPISYNPVDLAMARIADMDKFIMAHNVADAFKKEGLMKFVRFGEKPPEGWVKINDKIGEVYQFSEAEKGFIKRGDYYMPKDAARIINNYLSPGLSGNPIYDVIRKSGNIMTQANLGLSGFHGLFTTNDAIISKFALGLQQLSRGEVKKFIKTSLEAPTYFFRNVIHGNKLLEDYFKENPQMPELVDALIKAGGRVRMDSFYKNGAVESFLKALRSENYLGATVRTPGALIEAVSKPILQELVPRQKLGIFMDLAKDIFEQAKKEEWSDAKTTLRLQEAWDSMDNRLGEMVYDNLFWNKALKDLSMASVRAVGWNLGTLRELGGGLKDIVSIPYKLITGGEIRMTPRMAYTIALPIVVGVEGAILNYLFTGKPPETLLDYYYPKTGRKNPDGTDERISLPSYMKDVFAVGEEGLFKVASNKLNPIFGTIIDMLQNKDYYGTEIRNTNDPLVKQIAQEFQFLVSQFEPFSIQNAIRGQSPLAKYGSLVGLTVAPSYITKTPLEKKIMGMYEYRFGKETQTKGQKERQDFLNQIRKAYTAGDKETANKLLQEAEQKGYFTTKAVESKFVGDSDLPLGVRMFRRLPSEDQEKLLKDMNLAELNQYAWYASEEVKSKLSSLSENTKQFVEMVNNGEIKKPIWKAGKIINQ